MDDESFYIDLDPSLIGLEIYFASKFYRLALTEKENSQIMPFYFYNDELLTISTFIKYASLFLPIIGWILALIGLISKSLSGL